MLLGEFQRQARGCPCVGFVCVLHVCCIKGYIIFYKLLRYSTFYYQEVNQDIVCVRVRACVCVCVCAAQ